MIDDRAAPAASVVVTAAKLGEPASQSAQAVEKGHRQKAIKSLLATAGNTINGKLATVKTAHYLDADRFQSAFRSLMGK